MLLQYSLILTTALVVSFILTPLAGRVARTVNAVDYPGGRRIHLSPTPRFGGVAIFGGIIASLVVGTNTAPGIWHFHFFDERWILLAACATLVTMVGLLDDRRSLSPVAKLIVEILVAGCIVAVGYRIEVFPYQAIGWINAVVSVVWITSVMNAVNLIDGLDGLAAGVSLIAAVGLLCQSLYYQNALHALILTGVCGAILGFLPFNFRRARVFLGDSGSLLLGLVLAVAAIQGPSRGSTSMVLPILAVGLPLAELFLTIGRRVLREFLVVKRDDKERRYALLVLGRPKLFTADSDHMHHRLINRGIGSVRAVLIFYFVSAGLAATAMVCTIEEWQLGYLLFLLALFAAARSFGYSDLQPLRKGLLLPILGRLSAARIPIFVCFDLVFSFVSLLLPFLFLGTQHTLFNRGWSQQGQLLIACGLVVAQLCGLAFGGIYRESYCVIGFRECVVLLRSVGLSIGAGLVVTLSLARETSIGLIILDGYLLATLVIGLRLSFAIFDYVFQNVRIRRVLVYGVNEGGSQMVGVMRANPELGLVPTGFIDDEEGERTRWFRGLRVYRTGDLVSLVRRRVIDEVFVPPVNGNGHSAGFEILTRCCSNLALPVNSDGAVARTQIEDARPEHVSASLVPVKQ
jgi:UDP-GlcNAc:undecaprenyl-phosphate GlcNAc-1-phosphate transferase